MRRREYNDFYDLLSLYGVPESVIRTLRKHHPIPDAYPWGKPPAEIASILPQEEAEWLFLFGPPGTGKSTRAAYAMACYLRSHGRLGTPTYVFQALRDDPTYPLTTGFTYPHCWLWVEVSDLLGMMKEDFNSRSGSSDRKGAELYNRALEAEYLVLDDLTRQPSDWELSQLDRLINRRYADLLPTVITSNFDTQVMATEVSERISRRIAERSRMYEMSEKW